MEFNIDGCLQIAGLLLGLLYLILEYRADKRMWIVGMILPPVSMCVYFRKGIYADCGLSAYYLIMAIYGYIVWTFGLRSKGSPKAPLPIAHIPASTLVGVIPIFLILWAALWVGLEYFTDSTVPVPDAFTTAASIVGTWMLARKYVEQWIVWIIVDIISAVLYVYKGIPFYAVLYSVYTVVAVFGLRSWARRAVRG